MVVVRLPRWLRALLVIAVLGASGLAGARFAQRLCNEPLDVSGTVEIPSWIDAIKNRDEFAYPAHVVMGTVLSRARCRPSAIGMQWLKAASHARNEAELRLATNGMVEARMMEPSDRDVRDELCRAVAKGRIRPQQITALEWAGLHCP